MKELSIAIGRFQHADQPAIHQIGEVLAGRDIGQARHNAITIFDSPDIAFQNFFIVAILMDAAINKVK